MKSKYTRFFSGSIKAENRRKNKYDSSFIPPDDELRVNALKRYKILDTSSEETFKNIAEVVAYTFKVPIALISFVEIDRVFYKDGFGSSLIGKSIDRKRSPCSLAILSNEVSQFRYSLEHPCILADESTASEAGYKFYLGAPLITRDGHNIGMLAIIDKVYRDYDENEKRTLRLASQIVMEQIELRLYSLNEIVKLDREIAERNRELKLTLDELKVSQKELDIFLYKASHDLRAPLTSTAGLLNLAMKEIADPMALDYITKLSAVNERMTVILSKLILIYNIIQEADEFNDSKKMDSSFFKALVSRILESCDQMARNKKIKIVTQVEANASYFGNPALLELIIANLFENAIYFHPGFPSRKDPFVRVFVSKTNENLAIEVTDNGEGIPLTSHDKIFEMFFKASPQSKSGLGLYIVRKIATKLGGQAAFQSEENIGSTFTVQVPAKIQ